MEKNQYGKNMFIGEDGKLYLSPEELFKANVIFENRQTVKNTNNPEIDIYKDPLRMEDTLNPEIDIYKDPLRMEDTLNPEIDIHNQFSYENSSNSHKRR